jgi:hypothetical protein
MRSSWDVYGQWSERHVRESKRGWIVESHSRYSGDVTGRKVLVPFSRRFPTGDDLNGEWNECMCIAEAIELESELEPCRVLRRGVVVR